MLFMGLWMPPRGEIHSSVLVAFGEVSTFAGALLGVIISIGLGIKNKRADLRRFALSNQNLNYDLLLREEISYLYFFLNLTM